MQNKANEQVHAGFFVRLAAYLVDMVLVGAALLCVKIPMWISSISGTENVVGRDFFFQYSIADIVVYVLSVSYFIFCTYKFGATIGKKLFHLKVVSMEDRRPTFFEIIYRETIGRFLAGIIANFGYFMVGLKGDKRGIHDMLSDTKVVYAHTYAKDDSVGKGIYVPATYAIPEERKPSKVIHVGLTEHAAVLKKRLLKRIPADKLQPIEIELKLSKELQCPESYRITKQEERWLIEGYDKVGLYYGIGKFLHSAKWTDNAISPVETGNVITPNSDFRAIYFAVHFYNWYQMAPVEELERYVEDLLLYGYNTIVCILPSVNLTSFEEELFANMVEKTRAIYQLAKKYGMRTGFIVNPNQGIKSTPETFGADLSFDESGIVRPHAGTNVCQHREGALEHLQWVWRSLLEPYKDIGLDYIVTWPYDEGGCGCEKCKPWGAKGYGDLVNRLKDVVLEYYPDVKFVVSTWLFDAPDGQGEYEGFYQRLKEDLSWIDYVMVDHVGEFPRYPLEHEVIKPIVNFPEISMWKHWPWGGKGANPLPKRFQRLWNETKHVVTGGMPYSEGMFEDISKVQCVGYYWDAERPYRGMLAEYINYEFSSEKVQEILEIIEVLEDCHVCLSEKVEPDLEKVFATAELAREVDATLPQWAKTSWRWRILYIRTQLDKILCETYIERDKGTIDGLRKIRDTSNSYLDDNEEAQGYLQELCKLYHCVSENGENRYTRPPVKDGIVKE